MLAERRGEEEMRVLRWLKDELKSVRECEFGEMRRRALPPAEDSITAPSENLQLCLFTCFYPTDFFYYLKNRIKTSLFYKLD